jgi:hypothetical protein
MKFYPFVLIVLQVAEFSCYAFLYWSIFDHDRAMVMHKIITRDAYQTRKRMHMFTLYAQVAGWTALAVDEGPML